MSGSPKRSINTTTTHRCGPPSCSDTAKISRAASTSMPTRRLSPPAGRSSRQGLHRSAGEGRGQAHEAADPRRARRYLEHCARTHSYRRHQDCLSRHPLRPGREHPRPFPGGGATVRFVHQAGWGNAMRYMLTGDHWSAEEARRIGVVQRSRRRPRRRWNSASKSPRGSRPAGRSASRRRSHRPTSRSTPRRPKRCRSSPRSTRRSTGPRISRRGAVPRPKTGRRSIREGDRRATFEAVRARRARTPRV